MDVTTFGSFQSTRKTYDIVSFSLSTEKENIKIKALVTPIICPPLSVMMRNLKMPPELKGLKLADRLQSSENLDVDIFSLVQQVFHHCKLVLRSADYWKNNKN